MKRFFENRKRRHQSINGWSRIGSATMEYVILIAVGALFASLLYMAMSDGEGLIQSALEKKVREIIQGQLHEGEMPSGDPSGINAIPDFGDAPGLGDPTGGDPESGSFPDTVIPPVANGIHPPHSESGSGNPATSGGKSATSTESREEGGLSGWWDKTKNYVASGQILKDAAYIGKETLDFLILDDVSGCFTGRDTDGNRLAGWERGLSCVSPVPAAKWAKLGKYADEALTFAGKLDDKLAGTRLGEGLQTGEKEAGGSIQLGKRGRMWL